MIFAVVTSNVAVVDGLDIIFAANIFVVILAIIVDVVIVVVVIVDVVTVVVVIVDVVTVVAAVFVFVVAAFLATNFYSGNSRRGGCVGGGGDFVVEASSSPIFTTF